MLDFVCNRREIDFAMVSGSIPPNNDTLWDRFDSLGINVEKQQRGQMTGNEVAVDESIQLAMANRVLDAPSPGTMVLCTGDGSGYLDDKGFIKQLKRVHKHGWSIEVISWDAGCNRHLKDFAQEQGTYRSLESVYDQITFINNKRWATGIT